MTYTATITGIGPDSTVPENPRAVDADIFISEQCIGEVTLMPHEQTGDLGCWGDMEHWASQPLINHLRSLDKDRYNDAIEEIIAAVVEVSR